jgi:hypothetical protein
LLNFFFGHDKNALTEERTRTSQNRFSKDDQPAR